MLRTIFVSILMAIGLWYSLRGAFYVLLFYLWFAYFRPDDWIWSTWVRDLNLSFIVGVYVVLATAFSKERFRFGIGQALMLAFLVQTAVSLLDSPANQLNVNLWLPWSDFARKVIVGFSIIVLVTTEKQLRLVLMVVAASVSFEGAKQGFAQLILNPGATNANPSLFLGDNNGVAVGMLMLIPVLTALARTSPYKLERFAERFIVVGILYRALSTYSRGGFLAAVGLGLYYMVRSTHKIRTFIAVALAVGIITPALPDAFWDRMRTIQTAATAEDESELDVSQASRLHFWRVAVVMAQERPLTGVGFNAYNYLYDRYDFRNGEFGNRRSVHSAWYGLLAEVGYVGLGLYILLFLRAFYVNWRARRLARARPDLMNLLAYGTALEAALITFAIGGAFVPFQYNEMLWHFLALTVVIDRLIRERLASPAPVAAPATVAPSPRPMTRPAVTVPTRARSTLR